MARGTALELLRPDASGRLQTIVSTDVFGLVRSLAPLRLTGQTTDYLVVGSDSGKLVVLQYRAASNAFVVVHSETFGKTGVRRITPGHFVAREPHGRAILVAAPEKQKFVYVMNRDASNNLTISSPLEAHKAHTLLFDAVGLDTGFDNPIFACLEVDYGEADTDPTGAAAESATKQLTYYELDLGLNHVVRKWSRETDRGANLLVPVPGPDSDGPGGVLVLSENWILYEHSTHGEAVRTPIPRRTEMPDGRGLLLVSWAMHKSKSSFFFLAQSELGDLYKISLTLEAPPPAAAASGASKRVKDVVIKYFDTIPPSNSLCITRNGLLFAAAEFGNHQLYEFLSLGDGDAGVASAAVAEAHAVVVDASAAEGAAVEVIVPVFSPLPLRNLSKMDESSSLAALVDAKVIVPSAAAAAHAAAGGAVVGAANVGLSMPQVVTLTGRGPRSTLRILRQGLAVTEVAVSPMPGAPLSVFTLKASQTALAAAAADASSASGGGGGGAASSGSAAAGAGPSASAASAASPHPDKYIVMSFSNATVTLAVGETIEEVPAKDIGFSDSVPTLAVAVLADGSFLQIYPAAMRMITFMSGTKGPVREWKPPGPRKILRAAVNSRQVVLALSGGELVYFEYDSATRQLKEAGKKALGAEVTAMALPPVPEGRVWSPFFALADTNNMVRILSLDPEKLLEQASAQALRAGAESLALVNLQVHGPSPSPHLFIGLQNGVLSRLTMDPATGVLTDPRVRFLGVRPIRLVPVVVAGAPAVLALSTRPYLAYNFHGRFFFQSLTYDTLSHAAALSTEALPEALVAVAGNTFRIAMLGKLGEPFNSKTLSLNYTPRKLAFHLPTGLAVIAEADHNAYNKEERLQVAAVAAEAHPEVTAAANAAIVVAKAAAAGEEVEASAATALAAAVAAGGGAVEEEGHDPQAEGVDARRVGYPLPPEAGKWASCIRLVDLAALSGMEAASVTSTTASSAAVHHVLELANNEAAVSCASASFHDYPDEHFVIVGCAADMTLHPRKARECSLHTYRVVASQVPVTEGSSAAAASGGATQDMEVGATAASTRQVFHLQLVHKTVVEDIPYAIASFLGRVLVGVGRTLRLYDMGKKRLLRKCESRPFPTLIQSIHSSLDRVFVCDAQESVHFLKYKRAENVLVTFADDTMSRHMTAALVLDHDTVMGGDRFGNVFVLRVPPDVSEDLDNPSGNRLLWDSAMFNGAPNKCSQVASFYVGSAITSLQKAVLNTGGVEVVLYTTVTGAVGALVPLATKDDVDFFTKLELFLRNDPSISLVGREHTSFRSAFAPVSVSLFLREPMRPR